MRGGRLPATLAIAESICDVSERVADLSEPTADPGGGGEDRVASEITHTFSSQNALVRILVANFVLDIVLEGDPVNPAGSLMRR